MTIRSNYLQKFDSFEKKILLLGSISLLIIICAIAIERLNGPSISPISERKGEVSNNEYKVRWYTHDTGAVGTWGTRVYIVGPLFLPFSDKLVFDAVEIFNLEELTLDELNLLTIKAENDVCFLTDVSHFNCERFRVEYELDYEFQETSDLMANDFVVVWQKRVSSDESIIALEIEFVKLMGTSRERHVFVLNADSLRFSFKGDRELVFDCKWGDSAWGRGYSMNLENLLTQPDLNRLKSLD
jgi:hypothetical protein